LQAQILLGLGVLTILNDYRKRRALLLWQDGASEFEPVH